LSTALAKYFSRPRSKPLLLVVHNIDGPALRSDRIQSSLAELAAAPRIHLLASIDHIQAGLMWSAQHSAQFNFVCHDLTTFAPYATETSYEDQVDTVFSRLVQMDIHSKRNQKITVRSVLFVMRSLTALAKNIFRVLAECQLAQQSGSNADEDADEYANEEDGGNTRKAVAGDLGMPYADYFAECQSMLLVTSDSAFRNQLTEFRDHFIIQSRLDQQGSELLFIPLPSNDLKTVLNEMS
jgi:origin recognition complex subunit 2